MKADVKTILVVGIAAVAGFYAWKYFRNRNSQSPGPSSYVGDVNIPLYNDALDYSNPGGMAATNKQYAVDRGQSNIGFVGLPAGAELA